MAKHDHVQQLVAEIRRAADELGQSVTPQRLLELSMLALQLASDELMRERYDE